MNYLSVKYCMQHTVRVFCTCMSNTLLCCPNIIGLALCINLLKRLLNLWSTIWHASSYVGWSAQYVFSLFWFSHSQKVSLNCCYDNFTHCVAIEYNRTSRSISFEPYSQLQFRPVNVWNVHKDYHSLYAEAVYILNDRAYYTYVSVFL